MINYQFINQSSQASWLNYRQYIRAICNRTELLLKLDKTYSFSIILMDEADIHVINRDYRQIDRPTDVISFASNDEDVLIVSGDEIELGDIFINVHAIRSQAEDFGHSLKREFSFLVTHGLLHLLGYDHNDKVEEEIMIKLQEEILSEIARR
jgi:probable rRNA maturation factor